MFVFLFLTEEAYSHGGLLTRDLGQTQLRSILIVISFRLAQWIALCYLEVLSLNPEISELFHVQDFLFSWVPIFYRSHVHVHSVLERI